MLKHRQITNRSLISVAQRKSFFAETKGVDKLRKLKKSLEGEIAFEESQLIDYANTFVFFQKNGWTVSDLPKSPYIILSKTIDKKVKAVLALKAQSPNMQSEKMTSMINRLKQIEAAHRQIMNSEEDAANNANKQLAMQMIDSMNQFVVQCPLYINFGSKQSLKLELAFSQQNVVVTGCSTTNQSIEDNWNDLIELKETLNNIEYDQFNEDVKKSIFEFLESLGVDKEFSVRCQQLSMAKDQQLYYDFLRHFSELVDIK